MQKLYGEQGTYMPKPYKVWQFSYTTSDRVTNAGPYDAVRRCENFTRLGAS